MSGISLEKFEELVGLKKDLDRWTEIKRELELAKQGGGASIKTVRVFFQRGNYQEKVIEPFSGEDLLSFAIAKIGLIKSKMQELGVEFD